MLGDFIAGIVIMAPFYIIVVCGVLFGALLAYGVIRYGA